MKLAPQTNPPTSLSVGARKYSTELCHELQQLVRTPTHISASSMPESLHSAFRGLINASVANSTWRKYTSAWRAFQAFEVDNEYTAEWPLDQPTVRAFATWCLTHRGLQPSTTQSYLSALRFAHHLQNLSLDGLNEDPVLDMIFAGARNIELANVSRPNTRRVVTFQLLLIIGHRVARTTWDPLTKQLVWTCCTVTFFTSARLGELLASSEKLFDPTANLLWRDILFNSDDSALLRLKIPKSAEKNGEFLDLFAFPDYNCCPI